VRMALENPRWGHTRIRGRCSTWCAKSATGPLPMCASARASSPRRSAASAPPWSMFLEAHWRSVVAADFFTAAVWSLRGFVTYCIFFLIDLATPIVRILGITTQPDERWMLQIARNLTDTENGTLDGKSPLIIDRDTKYSAQFRRLVAESRTAVIRLPPRSPNLTAYAGRFVRSVKEECPSQMTFVGQASLRRAIAEFTAHYHRKRDHQGIANRLIQPAATHPMPATHVQRHQRLGEMLNFYCNASSSRIPVSATSPTGRRSSHDRRHSQDRLPLLRIQGTESIEPDALVLNKSLHVIELQPGGLSQDDPGIYAKYSGDSAQRVLPHRGPRTAFDLRQIPLTEPAALGKEFLTDSMQLPDSSHCIAQPQASPRDPSTPGASCSSHSTPHRARSSIERFHSAESVRER